MLENLSSQEKLETNQEQASTHRLLETGLNWIKWQNNERENATKLLQEAEIDTTVLRKVLLNTMLSIQRNYL